MWQHWAELHCPALCILQHGPALLLTTAGAAEGQSWWKVTAVPVLPPPAFCPLPHNTKQACRGWWRSTPLPVLQGMAMPTHTPLGHLGSGDLDTWEVVISIFFSQYKLGLLQCTGLWVSLDYWGQMSVWFHRTGSLLCLSLCFLLRSDQHTSVIEGLRETGTKSEC